MCSLLTIWTCKIFEGLHLNFWRFTFWRGFFRGFWGVSDFFCKSISYHFEGCFLVCFSAVFKILGFMFISVFHFWKGVFVCKGFFQIHKGFLGFSILEVSNSVYKGVFLSGCFSDFQEWPFGLLLEGFKRFHKELFSFLNRASSFNIL